MTVEEENSIMSECIGLSLDDWLNVIMIGIYVTWIATIFVFIWTLRKS